MSASLLGEEFEKGWETWRMLGEMHSPYILAGEGCPSFESTAANTSLLIDDRPASSASKTQLKTIFPFLPSASLEPPPSPCPAHLQIASPTPRPPFIALTKSTGPSCFARYMIQNHIVAPRILAPQRCLKAG